MIAWVDRPGDTFNTHPPISPLPLHFLTQWSDETQIRCALYCIVHRLQLKAYANVSASKSCLHETTYFVKLPNTSNDRSKLMASRKGDQSLVFLWEPAKLLVLLRKSKMKEVSASNWLLPIRAGNWVRISIPKALGRVSTRCSHWVTSSSRS